MNRIAAPVGFAQRVFRAVVGDLPPVCRHIFQNANNAAISVLISFQIEQALQKESGPQSDII